ncbi:MAG: hypothetical protein AB8G16_06405 [Gammaproteobacteria bacterium]
MQFHRSNTVSRWVFPFTIVMFAFVANAAANACMTPAARGYALGVNDASPPDAGPHYRRATSQSGNAIGRLSMLKQINYIGSLDILDNPEASVTGEQIWDHYNALQLYHGASFSDADEQWIFENAFMALTQFRDNYLTLKKMGELQRPYELPKNLPQEFVRREK